MKKIYTEPEMKLNPLYAFDVITLSIDDLLEEPTFGYNDIKNGMWEGKE